MKIVSTLAKYPREISEAEWEAQKDTVYKHWSRADENDRKVVQLSERTIQEIKNIKKQIEANKKKK
jgi:hypothetical protein